MTKRHVCCHVIKGRSCTAPARWEFWDAAKAYLDTYYYSCARHLSAMLDPDHLQYVSRIEY